MMHEHYLSDEAASHLPALSSVLASAHVLSIPMKTRFRSITTREVMLFPTPRGWVEFSPFLEYEVPEAAWWLAAALEAGWGQEFPARRSRIPVNATLPAVDASQVPAVLSAYENAHTIPTLKVKVGGETTWTGDLARLHAARDFLGETAIIRIDVNGAWALDEALANLTQLAEEGFELEYAEQPVERVEDLARLREALRARGIEMRIAADESIRKASDPYRVAALGAADLIVVKAQPLGGARRLVEIVSRTGLPAVVSSALDSSVGISYGARVAACLPELPFACGLATTALFKADVIAGSLVKDFAIIPRCVTPEESQLSALAASPERAQWWHARLTKCWQHIENVQCQ